MLNRLHHPGASPMLYFLRSPGREGCSLSLNRPSPSLSKLWHAPECKIFSFGKNSRNDRLRVMSKMVSFCPE